MTYSHRIDTFEKNTPLAVPVSGTAGLQVVIGLSPVNMADDPLKAVNNPVIARTYNEAASQLGYCTDFENYTLCQSINASFMVFPVSPVIFINVLDPRKHKKEYSREDILVSSRIATVEDIGIFLEDLKVSVTGEEGETELERDKDYVVEFNTVGGLAVSLLSSE